MKKKMAEESLNLKIGKETNEGLPDVFVLIKGLYST